jgi:hypothetical protein
MCQILVPIFFVPVFGSERLIWLLPVLVAIFVIDRELDGRFGILIPDGTEEETKEANKTSHSNPH